jgi:hypothetical protein
MFPASKAEAVERRGAIVFGCFVGGFLLYD